MMDAEWFAELEAIPGLDYKSPLGPARKKLPGHDAKPTIRKFSMEGRTLTSVMWQLPDGGSTSQSPSAAWRGSKGPLVIGPDLLRRLYEALALPGSATDYHFGILGACGLMWAQRRDHPEMLEHLEQLCLLDIRLVEIRPEPLRAPNGQMARIPTFEYLVRLYEREGLFEEALDIARRGAALQQGDSDVRRLDPLVSSLRAEDAP
jgi:hypothetical protein